MVPYLRAANVQDGSLDLSDVKEMNFDPSEQQIFSLRSGDVLVTEGSGSLSAVGASAVWNREIEKTVCFQNTLLRLRPRSSTDARFLAWWCRHAFADGLFAAVATGANIFHVSAQRVRSLPMTYVPLARQRAIADFLDTETARIDALITKKRRLIALLEGRLRQETREAVTLGQRYADPLEVSIYDRLAGDVTPLRLSWVARFGSGTTPISGNEHYYDGGSIPWVLTGDLNDGDLSTTSRAVTEVALHEHSALKAHEPGSLVVAMYGATIGKMSILRMKATVNQACCVITPGHRIEPMFLFHYLLAFREQLIELGRGSGQPNISQEILRNLRLPVPTRATQAHLVRDLQSAHTRSRSITLMLNRQIDTLQEHRQALITAAVTGELEVPGVAA